MKKWIFTLTSHLFYVFGLLIFFILVDFDKERGAKFYLHIVPHVVFIMNLSTPFMIHVKSRYHNNGKASGGPLDILWNYIRGNNSYNGQEEVIYARTVSIIFVISFVWIILNKIFLY